MNTLFQAAAALAVVALYLVAPSRKPIRPARKRDMRDVYLAELYGKRTDASFSDWSGWTPWTAPDVCDDPDYYFGK
jgi:hypothetical protein